MDIKLSVIIPVYKVEPYLRECIDSVLSQTLKDMEIILVDDGSPDFCPQICDYYAGEHENVKVIHKKNGGLSDARNCGLRDAVGKYVIFLDSDDFYNANCFLENIVDRIENTQSDLLMFQRQYYIEDKKEYQKKPKPYTEEMLKTTDCGELFYLQEKASRLEASASMKLIKRSILLENDLFFKEGLLSEDVEWFFRLSHYISSACVSNDVAYIYRRREGSITKTISTKHVLDMVDIVTTCAKRFCGSRETEDKKTLALLSYLSYQYYITLGLVWNHLDDRQKYLKELKKYRWLADYSISRKTRIVALALKILRGGVYAILGWYITRRK